MKPKFRRIAVRSMVINAYCGAYTERGLTDRAALVAHIPGVTKADFMRRCCIWHLAEVMRK